MTSHESVRPPPLPEASAKPAVPARFRPPAFILAAAVCAAAATDFGLWSEDVTRYGLRGYGAACALVAVVAAVFAMRKDVVWKTPAFAGVIACAVASAWTGCPLVIVVAPALLLAWTSRTTGEHRERSWPVAVLLDWSRTFLDALGRVFFRSARGRVASLAAGAGALVFFLWILGSGNLALGHWLEKWEKTLGDALSLDTGTVGRVALWLLGIALLSPLAVPGRKRKIRVPTDPVAAPVPATIAALVGANLAFLASNLTDTWCIGVRHAAPEGVSTTDYLHSGTYSLVFDAMLAALLLIVLFRNGAPARVSRPAKLLGATLLAQCAWLGLGVFGRVVLQVDRLGFTPNRVWVVVILIWGYGGLAAVRRYLRVRPEFGAFVRSAFAAALAILCVIQFRPPELLATDLNLACFRSHPEWKFDDGYFAATGRDGYRLWRETNAGSRSAGFYQNKEADFFEKPSRDWRVRSLRDDALDALYENDRAAKNAP